MKLYIGTDDGVAVYQGQQEEWRPRYLRLQGHTVTALATRGDQAWAGTLEGLWRSPDGGATWQPADAGLSVRHVRSLALYPGLAGDAGLLLAGTEPAAIFASHDAGVTWTESADVARLRDARAWSLPYSPAAGCVRGFASTTGSPTLYAAVEVGGVLRSDDAGATWQLLDGGVHPDVHAVAQPPDAPDLVYAATGGGSFRSQDGGQSWDLIGEGYVRAVWIDPDHPQVVLTGPARYVGAMGRIERSGSRGDTWTLASDGLRVPMSDMVENFVGAGSHVLALTSDGALYTARRGLWIWRPLDLGLPSIRAVVVEDTAA
jgi:photosystem II stability/assembly factor-like uncharacterized protein